MRLVLASAVLLLGFGCERPTEPPANGPGMVAVQWAGFKQGSLLTEGTASWCVTDSLLEILAVKGDTGVGWALLVQDSVRATQHPVLSPSVVVDWRPLATAAVRWFGEADVTGFEAYSGNVHVTEAAAGMVSGTVDLRLRVTGGPDTLRLTGTFTRIPVGKAPGQCGRQARIGAPPR